MWCSWEEGGLAIGLGVVFMGGGGTGYRAWCGVHGRRGDWPIGAWCGVHGLHR